jgi:hypothetical protein
MLMMLTASLPGVTKTITMKPGMSRRGYQRPGPFDPLTLAR